MKGLIKYNLYTMKSSLVFLIVLLILSSVAGLIAPPFLNLNSNQIFAIAPSFSLILFGAFGRNTLNDRIKSGWNKFEIVVPINKSNVISSIYLTDIVCVISYLVFHSIYILVFLCFYGYENIFNTIMLAYFMDIVILGCALLMISFSRLAFILLIPALSEIAGLIGLFAFMISVNYVHSLGIEMFIIGNLVFSIFFILLYILSYLVISKVYQKKEIT